MFLEELKPAGLCTDAFSEVPNWDLCQYSSVYLNELALLPGLKWNESQLKEIGALDETEAQ